jgi:hypothetical protein
LSESADAECWSRSLGIPFHAAVIETNGHNLTLIFADLIIEVVATGYAPFVVPDGGPEFKVPLP